MASGCCSQSLVLPSISVNRNVTVPEGNTEIHQLLKRAHSAAGVMCARLKCYYTIRLLEHDFQACGHLHSWIRLPELYGQTSRMLPSNRRYSRDPDVTRVSHSRSSEEPPVLRVTGDAGTVRFVLRQSAQFTGKGSGSPFTPAMQLHTAICAINVREATVALAICGTTRQLGSVSNL